MKIRTFTFIVLCFFGFQIFAQQQPNSSFENWTVKTMYEEPGNFSTTNLQSYMTINSGNVTKSTQCQHGVSAARLQTIPGSNGNGNVLGAVFIGMPGPGGIAGGLPFSQKPIALQFYAKYNIQLGDTANVIVLLKRNGAMMAVASKKIVGSQLNYSQVTVPFVWFDYNPVNFPDTIAAIVTSSQFEGAIEGSELFIDNITLTGATATFPNGDFENWTAQTLEEPDSWTSINYMGVLAGEYSVTKSTDHYGNGNFSAKVKTIVIPSGNNSTDTMGFITNGRMGNNGPQGGLPVLAHPMKITGYYKYFPVGLDTALAGAFVYGHDDYSGQIMHLDSSIAILTQSSVYQMFEVNLSYQGSIPADTLNISFASSNLIENNNYVGAGSLLYIDAIQIDYFPTAIQVNPILSNRFVYPNPAKNTIYFDLHNTDSNALLEIFDAKGSPVLEQKISDSRIGLDISTLNNGLYFYKLNSQNTRLSGKFSVIK